MNNNACKLTAPGRSQGARLRVVRDNGPASGFPELPAPLQLAPRIPRAPAPAPTASPRRRSGLFVVASGHKPAAKAPDTLTQARRIVAQVEWEVQQRALREHKHRTTLHAVPSAAAPRSRFAELTATFRSAFGF